MRFHIAHRTVYAFAEPVFLEPHSLRITPRGDGAQRLLAEDIQVTPTPTGQTVTLDPENNTVRHLWFEGVHDRLEIATTLDVETLQPNPFDYLPQDTGWPVRLPPTLNHPHAPSLAGAWDPAILDLSEQLAQRSGHRPLPFLLELNGYLQERMEIVVRDEGPAWPSAKTLAENRGACRDLVVVFMEVCRAAGIPARFVSGYQAGDPVQEQRHLHAWAEAYVPGGGWRGYDPTLGLAVADQHIALAASAFPENTLPVEGAYRGAAAATLTLTLQIETA